MTYLVSITTHYASFGLVVRDGVVVEAAPIARWTVGRNARAVVGWWLRRGATIVVMEERDGARI